ncbi:MAG: O-antigen ligase family protein [Actinomycetota bacterium]|nr:O-antigen ligase family protein [Actinomycetota bacterium]
MSALLRQAPRWLVVAVFASTAAAVNVLLGLGAAVGQKTLLLAVVLGVLPAAVIAFGGLVESHRALLAWAALSINFTGLGFLAQPLPLTGGTTVFLTDVLLLLALGAWLVSRLSRAPARDSGLLSPVLGWPLILLIITVLSGVLIGHERYGASIIGEPVRLVLYAGIALTLTDVGVVAAWRAITIVFYAGAVIQALWAIYYLATGTSQTQSVVLTTGGVRVLALSVAIYLTGSLVCALLNLELERRPGRQFVHVGIAGLALFGIVVSFGRTTYAAVVLIVPLLLLTRRYLRRTVLVLLPLLAPALVLGALLVPTVQPTLVPTLQARLSGTSTNDGAVRWRERARKAALEGIEDEWLTGLGFGRKTTFTLESQVIRIQGDPHNSFIWILAGGGLLALASLLILLTTFVVDAVRRLRRAGPVGQALVAWSLATWFAFMVNAASGPILTDPKMSMTIWILMTLPCLVALEARRREPA